jgi:hypothetical protein
MQPDTNKSTIPTYQELLEQNEELRNELTYEKNIWATLVETSRKLQVSSSSIKAAVSSLLNYDIFWDKANEHEFHATINSSIDQMSELVKLVTLQSRLEAGALEFKFESNFLPEILSAVQVNVAKHYPTPGLKVSLPGEGSLVEVDYAYLTIALDLLLSVVISKQVAEGLQIDVREREDDWYVLLSGVNKDIIHILRLLTHSISRPDDYFFLPADDILKLRIALGIMKLQKIRFEFAEGPDQFSLILPIFIK